MESKNSNLETCMADLRHVLKSALLLGALALLTSSLQGAARAQEPACPLDRPVVFAGLDWASNAIHVAIARRILEVGYGCETTELPGSTIPLLAGLRRGDVDVTMEIWAQSAGEVWREGLERGDVVSVGVAMPDAVQGWYVPRYLVEGPQAEAPGLKSVFDLPQYKELFKDPEQPSKGRFYNCILGWTCEVWNTKKLHAYGLNDHYTNFRPGAGPALAAAIASAYKRGKPILAYYWGPTWVLGKYDLVKLEEPPFDAEVWAAMETSDRPDKAVAYPLQAVEIGMYKDTAEAAPELAALFSRYGLSNALVSELLAWMQDERSRRAGDAADKFFLEHEAIWSTWVDEDAAQRLRADLKD